MSLLTSLLKIIPSFMKVHFTPPSSHHHSYKSINCEVIKLKILVNFCYLNTNLCPSRLPLWHRHSHSVFYVSSPWLPGAPHLPWANTNLLLCGFPFSPVQDPHHWGCSRCRGPFFFHLCCHVKPRFIHLLNPNVIFTMLVCECWGNEAWLFSLFFWCF